MKEKIKTALPVLLFMPVYLIWFRIIEYVPFKFCIRTDFAIDEVFPFIRYFIIPYVAWFCYIPAVGIYLLFKDTEEFKSFQRLMIWGMVAFLLLNTFFPTAISLRPTRVIGSGLCAELVKGLYSVDTSTNVFPSIHVYTTVVAFLCMSRTSSKAGENKLVRAMIGIMSVSIVLATIFLKQHSLLDVLFGFLMCLMMNGINNRMIDKSSSYIKKTA
ncbi:MAG: phosphatase PAP2 family protein [Eubacterium sp.]|nr:phosphatase PAP2 family protein [Eubacterium sp.]